MIIFGKHLNLQTTIIILVCGVVAVSLAVTYFLVIDNVTEMTMRGIEERATNISNLVARTPLIAEALIGEREEAEIQQFTESIRDELHVRFIVILDMDGIRKSHPTLERIGEKFAGGDDNPVLNGEQYISIAEGTLGYSLRSFTPIYHGNEQVGAAVVGILLDDVQAAVGKSTNIIYIGLSCGFIVGLIGAWFLARKIKNIMFGMEPAEIAKIFEERNAILKAVKEGILAIDDQAKIVLVNAEATRLLEKIGIKDSPIGKNIEEVLPGFGIQLAIDSGKEVLNDELELGILTIVVNSRPVYVDGKLVGVVATFRDKTELKKLAEQLTGVHRYIDALRAQTHEFMNKLHIILGMVQLQYYDQLDEYVRTIANNFQDEVGLVIKHIKDPIISGFFLGKMSFAREQQSEIILTKDSYLPILNNSEMVDHVVTILGNLLDNAIDAVAGSELRQITVTLVYEDAAIFIEVEDTGIGIENEKINQLFTKGFSTKGGNRGFGLFLIQQKLEKLNGDIEVESTLNRGTNIQVCIPFAELLEE